METPPSALNRCGAARNSGVALVLVLSAIVLLTFLIVAFFSMAVTERRVAGAGKGKLSSQLLAETAMGVTLGDLLAEIEAHSDPVTQTGVTIFFPGQDVEENGIDPARMRPERTDNRFPNLIKTSRRNTALFEGGLALASPVATDALSANRVRVPRERWNAARLISPTDFDPTDFTPPDWILMTRRGPAAFASWTDSLKNRESADYVVGRYAFAIYDVGGLLDINVAGNRLDANANARRGRLHQVDLSGLGIDTSELVRWRWPNTGANPEEIPGSGGLFDPERNFLRVEDEEQAFASRQDLLRFAERIRTEEGDPVVPREALEFLTVFSRDLNAPSYGPDPGYDYVNPDGAPGLPEMNPHLLSVRHQNGFTARSGEEVPAGTPVLHRRFPLSRIGLLADPEADADDIEYYFGLRRATPQEGFNPPYSQNWEYTAAHDGRIARLGEVAEMGREPNFFEILQAVILNGSLGKHGGDGARNAASFTLGKDPFANYQIMQIGANIIDQYDRDDVPTTIRFEFGGGPEAEVYGVENVPFINDIYPANFRPEWDEDTMYGWMLFELWNPHQNAETPPGVDGFRIVPVSGRAYIDAHFQVSAPVAPAIGDETRLQSDPEPITGAAPLVFDADLDFAEPAMVAAEEPQSEGDQPGILVATLEMERPAFPRRNQSADERLTYLTEAEDAALQVLLNDFLDGTRGGASDNHRPYTVTNSEGVPVGSTGTGARGERIYEGTGLTHNANTTHWMVEDVNGDQSELHIWAVTGEKLHNTAMIVFDESDRGTFALEALVDGEWIRYQLIEGLTHTEDRLTDTPSSGWGRAPNRWNTDHTYAQGKSAGWLYFDWASTDNALSFAKIDPRTERFGYVYVGGSGGQKRNMSIRFTDEAWDETSGPSSARSNWILPTSRGHHRHHMGHDNSGNPAFDFEFYTVTTSGQFAGPQAVLAGLVTNHPEELSPSHPMRYRDPDGVIRPADGYRGALPTVLTREMPAETDQGFEPSTAPSDPNRLGDRPLVLNRPFRSVGELGYVFRDSPWRTLDFWTERSADAGLLDVFSIEDATLVPGKVNLNSARSETLQAVLAGTAQQLAIGNPESATRSIGSGEAQAIADALIAHINGNGPLIDPGQLVLEFSENPVFASEIRKPEREAAFRALAGVGTTRTWNLMIDLIAQSGRYPPMAENLANFAVEGETRIWLHVAIDRLTGEVVDTGLEVVDE